MTDKKSFIFVFLWLLCLGAAAQNISVKSFKALPMDLTAMSLEGKRVDQNGEIAALIKVVTTQTGFTFEGGVLGIVDTQQRNGEIWVWVPRGLRKMNILHQQLGVLRDYRFPVEIEAERTYEMVLTTAKIETIVKEEVRMQYLAFQISPPNATLVVDEKYWDVEADGSAQDYVNFGIYSWRVEAPNYHSDAGRVTVDDPNNAKIVTVTLQPNFGWIEVAGTGNLKDASVYVDNALIGRAPCKSEALKSGKHTVRITKKMYDAYTETVTIADNETTRLAPSLAADFAEVTLAVDADAEIYVNDERKGIRTWTGPLGSGTYKIECKQANHETSTTTKEVTAAMNGQTITLPAPRPIYGALNVESTPNFCKLYIDGKDMGTTPKSIVEILIGHHEIRLTKEGYNDYTETITIDKGERKQIKAVLNNVDYAKLAKKGDEYYDSKNYEEALKCYREAAENGDPVGQTGMGILYYDGYAVPKDDAEAVKWFRLAATQGLDIGQYSLAYMYYMGYGVSQDYSEAMKWYRKAAEQGNAYAQYNLGYMYENGEGVNKNLNEAKKWYQKAADQGHEVAKKALKRLR